MALGAEHQGEAWMVLGDQRVQGDGTTRGFAKRIPIDADLLSECRQVQDGPAGIALCQQLVDDLAARIKTVVAEAVRG